MQRSRYAVSILTREVDRAETKPLPAVFSYVHVSFSERNGCGTDGLRNGGVIAAHLTGERNLGVIVMVTLIIA
jgi:hypothetical protein